MLAAALAIALGAWATTAPASDGGSGSGLAQASKGKKKKSCKKKSGKSATAAKKKKKCKKPGGSGEGENGEGGIVPGLTIFGCPTGTVSGQIPVTITGQLTPRNVYPIEIDYGQYNHAARQFYGQHVDVATDANGVYTFTFKPNLSTAPYSGSWHEVVGIQNRGATVAYNGCEWDVRT